MNKLISFLERHFRPYAIPNVTVGLIAAQAIVYGLALLQPDFIDRIVLLPERVLQGEVWRLVLFLAQPPFLGVGIGLFFMLCFWSLFYLMGTALEQTWSVARYNLFLLIGYIATVGVSFVTPHHFASNAFLEGSVFLAFAVLYPNFEIRILFIIPVKVKWIALITWIFYAFGFVMGNWQTRLTILASVLNFFIFFCDDILASIKQRRRKMKWQSRQAAIESTARHRCVICGITERDDRFMDFRYCSKCAGTQCYCRDHLANHEHIVAS
jgi:hypothetical protein